MLLAVAPSGDHATPYPSRIALGALLVIQRGVNRGAIIVDDDDRHHLLDLLHDAAREHDLAIHAYVLMSSHVHLLLTLREAGALSSAMRRFDQCYVRAFNLRHRRADPLWQGRFKSCIVDSEAYLMTAYRCIELNLVRAAMTDHAEDYPWSSVRANLGLRTDSMVTSHPLFLVSTVIRPNALRSTGRGYAKA